MYEAESTSEFFLGPTVVSFFLYIVEPSHQDFIYLSRVVLWSFPLNVKIGLWSFLLNEEINLKSSTLELQSFFGSP